MQYLDITSCSEGHAENMHVQDMSWYDCWPLTRSNTTRERESPKPEGNAMITTEAATDSCQMACHSLRSMVCLLTVSTWIGCSSFIGSYGGHFPSLVKLPPLPRKLLNTYMCKHIVHCPRDVNVAAPKRELRPCLPSRGENL